MSWSTGNQITAAKLNSENHVVTYTHVGDFSGSSSNEHSGHHLFYCHDGGGTNNPIIIQWKISSRDEKYWGNWYAPAAKVWIEKRASNGTVIGSRYTICDIQNDDYDNNSYFTIDGLKNEFGSAEGWFYLYWWTQGDVHGSASMTLKVYGYPSNNKEGKPLRYFDSPSSSGYTTPDTVELTANILNTHRVGTYE
jgi:hypothetical protein